MYLVISLILTLNMMTQPNLQKPMNKKLSSVSQITIIILVIRRTIGIGLNSLRGRDDIMTVKVTFHRFMNSDYFKENATLCGDC